MNCFVKSALVGYEKPNPMIFLHALQETGEPEKVWMIGDNIEACCRPLIRRGLTTEYCRQMGNHPYHFKARDIGNDGTLYTNT
ncbi:HAD-IA family hydrolase [Paenibacillus thiaminolyticus]|uniref:HAD-IA family hydrolase n=1 Tax=Paenibacillus thiaminolyticus TaxID=49283 RepID=UPI0035A6F489